MEGELAPPGDEVGASGQAEPSLSDDLLLDLLDALVEERGRVPAAQILGVNYRTLANCCDSRQVSRRMKQALVDFRNAGTSVIGEAADGDGNDPPDAGVAALRQRVDELEDENSRLRELADDRARQIEQLTRRLAALKGASQPDAADEVVGVDADADDTHDHDRADGVAQDWKPPRRRPGMPESGVVTLEEQPDEEHAFGPAAPLVTEWRRLRTASGRSASRVDRAQAAVRRWELEAELLGEYRLTLPPDTFPLDDARRADHVRWRRDALAEARREQGRARRAWLLRRVLTLGLWRK